MKKSRLLLILAVGLTLRGQAPQTASFEVASIRPTERGRQPGLRVDGNRLTINSFSLKNLVPLAYSVNPYQVLNLDGAGAQRFDIAAVLPAGATRSDVPALLRSLLVDRFKMSAHIETEKSPGYALVVSKSGHKMQAVPPETEPFNRDVGSGGRVKFEFVNTMATMIDKVLKGLSDRPIVDKTGLAGLYSGTLEIDERSFVAGLSGSFLGPAAAVAYPQIPSSHDILSDALGPLGLRIENVEVPLDMIVVDHIESFPNEN